MRNEADTSATLIDPKLKSAGWEDTQIKREYYYQRDYKYTQGRVILVGNRVRRGKPRKVDYLLRLSDGFPIAVVEAKAESKPAKSGLEKAKAYARDLGLAFAYATNGRDISLVDRRPLPPLPVEEARCRDRLSRALRLLWGVGPATERRLREEGFSSLAELTRHPRWTGEAEEILRVIESRDLGRLSSQVGRWYAVSHPLSLSLLGLGGLEKILFLDIETFE